MGLGRPLEVVGRWFGLRGHRFLRATLDVEVAQTETRLEELRKELDDAATARDEAGAEAAAARGSATRRGRNSRSWTASATHSSKRATSARDERDADVMSPRRGRGSSPSSR